MAFFGISAFSVLAAVSAILAFLDLGGLLDDIVEDRVPAALVSLELSRQTDRLVIAAPLLLDVTSEEDHTRQSAAITAEAEKLRFMLAELRESVGNSEALESLETAVDWLSLGVTSLSTLVSNRLAIDEYTAELLEEVSAAKVAADGIIGLGLADLDLKLRQLQVDVEDPVASQSKRVAASIAAGRVLKAVHALSRARLEITVSYELLLKVAAISTRAQLAAESERLTASTTNLQAVISSLDIATVQQLAREAERFRGFVEDGGGLMQVRRRRFDITDNAERLVREFRQASRLITEAVDELVVLASKGIADAGREATAVRRASTGDITETSGDGLMVVFQHQDPLVHTQSAVATALHLFEITETLNQQRTPEPLQLHMGLNSAEALVGSTRFEGSSGARWVFTADGAAVNLAARHAALAGPGQILLTAGAVERLQERYPVALLGQRELKNIAGPVEIFRIERS